MLILNFVACVKLDILWNKFSFFSKTFGKLIKSDELSKSNSNLMRSKTWNWFVETYKKVFPTIWPSIYILLDVALQVDLDNAYRKNKEEAMKCFRDKSHPMIFIALSRA